MLSIIVPAFDEAENIEGLVTEILAAAERVPITEIIYVDDGSTDATIDILRQQQARCPHLRIIRHGRRMGQSAAFLSGARAAVTELLVFMDADGQNDPQDIAKLLRAFQGNLPAAAAVLGQRVGRRDVWSKRISSKLANRLRRAILHDNTRDTGCSLKLIRRADYLALPYFDHMHRFLPAMLMRNGVELRHVDVSHRPRARGVSKYGFRNRAFVGVVDLFGSAWLIQRGLPLDYSSTEIGKGSPL